MRLSLLLLLFSLRCFAFQITGTVSSDSDKLPFASVSVYNSSHGVFCDSRGRFQLELQAGEHTLISSYTGYKNDTLKISINADQYFNIVLQKDAIELNQLELRPNQEDPAYEMMRNITLYRDSFNYEADYNCNAYVKSSIEEPAFYTRKKQALNFVESVSQIQKKDNHLFETIISKNDFSVGNKPQNLPQLERISAYKSASNVTINPDIYFKNHNEAQIQWEKDFIFLPRLNSNFFVSPFAKNGSRYYTYKYTESFYNKKNQEIAIINVQAKGNKKRCFSGKLYINNTLHHIVKVALELKPSDISYYKRFMIQYEYMKSESDILPKSIDYQYGFNDLGGEKSGNTIIRYSNYTNNKTPAVFNKNLIYVDNQVRLSKTKWDSIRPIKLNETEAVFVSNNQKEEAYRNTIKYRDSLNLTLRKPSIHNLLLQGLTWRNDELQREIHLQPILRGIQLFNFGGTRIASGGYIEKSYKKQNSLKINGIASYGLNHQNWKGSVNSTYTYAPKQFGRVMISIGDNYDFLSFNQSLSAVISGSNFIDRQHLALGHEIELLNGLYWRIEGEYQKVKTLSGINAGNWRNGIFPNNEANNFPQYEQINLHNEWIIRFAQKYYLEGNKKIIVGSKLPELRALLIKSLPLHDLTSSFLYTELQVSDLFNWKKIGYSKYSFESGHFFKNNGVQLNNLKFFRGGDDWYFSNAMNTFQLVNRSGYQSQSTYFEGHLIHHFDGYLLHNLSIFKKLRISAFGGANYLWVNQEINHHTEAYIGLEKKYSIAKQRYRISLSYHSAVNHQFQQQNFIKFGIDWYNFLTNNWIN